jgi:uncharacterized membrane protein
MLDEFPLLIANGVGVTGLLVWLFWMLSTGRIVTRREHDDKKAENVALRNALEIRDRQLAKVLDEYLPAANSVMQALHQAGERHEAARDGNANAGEMSER